MSILEAIIPSKSFLNTADMMSCGLFDSPDEIRSACRRGLPAMRVGHRRYVVARGALLQWLSDAMVAKVEPPSEEDEEAENDLC